MASQTSSPWTVAAWPPYLCEARAAPQLSFVHLDTRVLHLGCAESPPNGQTLWGGRTEDGTAGVAWEWMEITDGVVAMTNPFGLITNLQLLGVRGEVLSSYEVMLRLNSLIHSLPWQTEVERALHAEDPFATTTVLDAAPRRRSVQRGRSISTWGMPSSR